MATFLKLAPSTHRVFSSGFYPDPDLDFEVRCLLGYAPYGGSDIGEVLKTIDGVPPGDREHWFRAWHDTASRVRTMAEAAAMAGQKLTASLAYLRSASYFAVALNAASCLGDDAPVLPTFRRHRSSWDGFIDTTPHAVEKLDLPYEEGTLPAWFFRPSAEPSRRRTLVMVNGSDGAISSLWSSGAAGGLARGYNVLIFDGPGQQSMLYERGIGFRSDWEAVLTPIVDLLLTREDVDPDRLALYGVSQGGFWVPRTVAYEHRFAAAIADPGVKNVSDIWLRHLPGHLKSLFRAGRKDAFDRAMTLGMRFSSQNRRTWSFRARPFRKEGYFDTLDEVSRYVLTHEECAKITTPLLITDPEDEQFWPGQSKELARHVHGPVEVIPFTAAEGANFHCQPLARQLTDARMFDWLDRTLSR
ncbi:MAG TPA: alpha/beta hydrolase [Myxococcaceae bacterium]|nr:alpha/beta hydrolase [Myxococcaceae bacterium]